MKRASSGLIWFGTKLTAKFIDDEVELERKTLNIKGLMRKDVENMLRFNHHFSLKALNPK